MSGGPTKFSVVNALPSVKSNIITLLEPSGELPETVVPPVPTSAGAGVPWTESPSFPLRRPARRPPRRIAEHEDGVVDLATLVLVANVVSTPAWPFGFGITGPAVNGIGVSMSLAWINSRL